MDYIDECKSVIGPYINGAKTDCSYCQRLNPLILLEGEFTYVTLAIGQIVEGYLQVCSKNHRTSATGLLDCEIPEFEIMKKVVRESFRKVYNNSGIAFEHGQAGGCLAVDVEIEDSLCHHTHTHFVPVDIDINKPIRDLLGKAVISRSVNEMVDIRTAIFKDLPYLYFENSVLDGFMYKVDKPIPRQFLRTCVAGNLGLSERADWLKYPGYEHMEISKLKLQPVLKDIYRTYS